MFCFFKFKTSLPVNRISMLQTVKTKVLNQLHHLRNQNESRMHQKNVMYISLVSDHVKYLFAD